MFPIIFLSLFWIPFFVVFLLKFTCFLHVRNLKNRAPVEARARFLQNSVFRVRWKKHQKIIKKSMDFQVEISENSFKNCFENSFIFGGRFFWDFEWIWDGFWEGLGGHWEAIGAPRLNFLGHL